MRKIIVVLIVCILAFTLSVAKENSTLKTMHQFAKPVIEENGDRASISIDGCSTLYMEGYPILPYTVKTYTFPLGTTIKNIMVTPSDIKSLTLTKNIALAPPAEILGGISSAQIDEGSKVCTDFTGNNYYPDNWYTSRVNVGVDNEKRVLIVSIHMFPVRYNSVENELMYARDIIVNIDYELPENAILTKDAYDLLIIAPERYVSLLEPLKEHKDSHGIETLLKTTETILSTYSGRDNAEKVKYAIKDAIEEYGIMYVLLVGGLDSHINNDTWLVPVRYDNLVYGDEKQTLCDLYFADIYKYDNGSIVFDDWDSNGNGIFAEYSYRGRDEMDFHPDVYVGRLACRNEKEVTTVVDKIITYENGCDPSWFNRVLLAGGDTFNDISEYNFLEGEIENQEVANLLQNFEAQRIWWSEGNTNQRNLIAAWHTGFGFVHLSGHGSPEAWFVKDFQQDPSGKYIWMLDVYHMPLMKNGEKLPIVVIGGCHNSMYDTSFSTSLIDVIKTIVIKYILGDSYLSYYWLPTPECQGWQLVKQPGGGAIATFGYTGYGLGAVGDGNHNGIPDCTEVLGGALELCFFKAYGEKDITMLGAAWGDAITKYVDTFDCVKDDSNRKTIQDWALLGDPSLHIGGYQ